MYLGEDSDGIKGQQGRDNDHALFGQTNKVRGKGPIKGKVKGENSTSCTRNKDLSKAKCFICNKHGHYPSQFLEKKKGKGNQQQIRVSTSTET